MTVTYNAFTGNLDFTGMGGAPGGEIVIQTPSGTATSVNGIFDFTESGAATISASGNTINFDAPAAGSLNVQQISTNQQLVKNTIYFCNSPGGALVLPLPDIVDTTPGDRIIVMLDGATSFQISQAVGQQILYGNLETTSGAAGYLLGDTLGDSVDLIAQTDSRWCVISPVGSVGVN